LPEADEMLAPLMERGDALMGSTEGSEEERELAAITGAQSSWNISGTKATQLRL
jgi:hypothetical protein